MISDVLPNHPMLYAGLACETKRRRLWSLMTSQHEQQINNASTNVHNRHKYPTVVQHHVTLATGVVIKFDRALFAAKWFKFTKQSARFRLYYCWCFFFSRMNTLSQYAVDLIVPTQIRGTAAAASVVTLISYTEIHVRAEMCDCWHYCLAQLRQSSAQDDANHCRQSSNCSCCNVWALRKPPN